FHAPGGVTRVAGAVEDGVGIGLLRLVIENQHDFSVRVDVLVIVVSKLGRGDAVASEDYLRGHINIGMVRAQRVGKFPLLLASAAGFRRDPPSGKKPGEPELPGAFCSVSWQEHTQSCLDAQPQNPLLPGPHATCPCVVGPDNPWDFARGPSTLFPNLLL